MPEQLSYDFQYLAVAALTNGLPRDADTPTPAPAPQTAAYERGGERRDLWQVQAATLTGAASFSHSVGKVVPALITYQVVDAVKLEEMRTEDSTGAEAVDRRWEVFVVGGAGARLYVDFVTARGSEAVAGVISHEGVEVARLIITALPITAALHMLEGDVRHDVVPAVDAGDGAAAGAAAALAVSLGAQDKRLFEVYARRLMFANGHGLLPGDGGKYFKLPNEGGGDTPAEAVALGLPAGDATLPRILTLTPPRAEQANYPLRGGALGDVVQIAAYSASGNEFVFCSPHYAAMAALFANFPTEASFNAAPVQAPANGLLTVTGHDDSAQTIGVNNARIVRNGASGYVVMGGFAASLPRGEDSRDGVGLYRLLRRKVATVPAAAGGDILVARAAVQDLGVQDLWLAGEKVRRNYVAMDNAAPTAMDDVNRFFEVGSQWVTADGRSAFICTANAAGAAEWEQWRGRGLLWSGNTNATGEITLTAPEGDYPYYAVTFELTADAGHGASRRTATMTRFIDGETYRAGTPCWVLAEGIADTQANASWGGQLEITRQSPTTAALYFYSSLFRPTLKKIVGRF